MQDSFKEILMLENPFTKLSKKGKEAPSPEREI